MTAPAKAAFEPLIPIALATLLASLVASAILAYLSIGNWGESEYHTLALDLAFYAVFVLSGVVSGLASGHAGLHVVKSYVIVLVTTLFHIAGISIILVVFGFAFFPLLGVPFFFFERGLYVILALSVPFSSLTR